MSRFQVQAWLAKGTPGLDRATLRRQRPLDFDGVEELPAEALTKLTDALGATDIDALLEWIEPSELNEKLQQQLLETTRRTLPEIQAVEEAVIRLRGGDATLPIHVIVPNHLLGVWLSRSIFAETGHFAIDFVLPHELAWRIAAPHELPKGRAPAPEYADQALLLDAVAEVVEEEETPDYLVEASKTAGFVPAALATLQELENVGLPAEALEQHASETADPARLELLARLMRARRKRLEKNALLDRPQLYRAAAAALPSPVLGGVVVCGRHNFAPAAQEFLTTLKQNVGVEFLAEDVPDDVVPRHGSRAQLLRDRLGLPKSRAAAEPRSALERVQQRLFRRSDAGTTESLDPSLTFLSAAGQGLEAVEIARRILRAADEGLRFEEIALLSRNARPYSAHFASAFDRAGIPGYFFEGTPQLDPAARGLWLLLDLLGTSLERGRVMEFLTTALAPWDALFGAGAAISPARWDRLSGRAGIVSGLTMWRARLDDAIERAESIEDESWRERDTALAKTLRRVIERLAADLAAFPKEGGWSEFLDATLQLLESWNRAPERTAGRLETVLRPLARFAPRPTRDEFLARVRSLLATQTYSEGELGAGRVFVGSIAAARGVRFRLVFVAGLVERVFPGVVRPDPLLLDDERASLSPALRTTLDGYEDERLLLVDAAKAATERLVLSYPRFDGETGREQVPSSFLTLAAEAALGRRVSAGDMLRLAEAGETSLGRPHPRDAGHAVDLLERDLALVASGERGTASHLARADTFVARSLALETAQWKADLTPFDGIVDIEANASILERLAVTNGSKSATQLETLSQCPYKYLLRRGFKLYEWDEPDRAYQLEGKDYGTIFHDVMEALFSELHEVGSLPISAAALDQARTRARELLDVELERVRATGEIVHPALLEPTAARLWADIRAADESCTLQREVRAADEWTPGAFELHFKDVGNRVC